MLLVTRPGEPGRRLAAGVDALGYSALWWPAFDLLPPADPQPVRETLARLRHFDLVVFVSPMAVRALAAGLGAEPWPAAVRIAAVGGASVRSVRRELPLDGNACVVGPPGAEASDGGVEALWPALARLDPPARSVLIVRAQSGRPWLAERLRESGAQVEELEAYRRVAHEASPADWAALRHVLAGAGTARTGDLVVLFSSTEAVGVLTQSLEREQLGPQLAGARALCVHDRIVQAARAAGWRDVRLCEPEAAAVAAALAASGDPVERDAMRPGAKAH